MILTLFKEFADAWWEEKTLFVEEIETFDVVDPDDEENVLTFPLELDGESQILGTVPRTLDEIDFVRRVEDELIGEESCIMEASLLQASPYNHAPLTFNGDWTLGETQWSDFRFDSSVWEAGDGGDLTIRRVNGVYPYNLQTVLQSAVVTLNEQISEYNLSTLVGLPP
jgi:hypothetical protein